MNEQLSWFTKNEFLIRRLHSLSGLVPVGAYMIVHLVTNSLILVGESTFQNAVYQIHSLGPLLVFVEWGFIFLPLIFHAVFGVVIILGGKSNVKNYPTTHNVRYMLQRVTGVIAMIFIFMHVFHLHGWFHLDAWLKSVAEPMGMAQFRAYNAASTAAGALQASVMIQFLYAIGVLACVYHLANGIWTMGITWGVWTSPKAQHRASLVCAGMGALVALIGLSSLLGFARIDVNDAKEIEDRMYEERTEDGSVVPDSHKRSDGHHETDEDDISQIGSYRVDMFVVGESLRSQHGEDVDG